MCLRFARRAPHRRSVNVAVQFSSPHLHPLPSRRVPFAIIGRINQRNSSASSPRARNARPTAATHHADKECSVCEVPLWVANKLKFKVALASLAAETGIRACTALDRGVRVAVLWGLGFHGWVGLCGVMERDW
jgi:hypothetical protein